MPQPNKKKKPSMDKLTPPEKAHIEELLKGALQDYAVRQSRDIKDKQQMASEMSGYISEFLGPFMLMGYDTKGEPFSIMHAHSQLDLDALTTLLNKFLFNVSTNGNE